MIRRRLHDPRSARRLPTTISGYPRVQLVLAERRLDDGSHRLKVRTATRPNDGAGWVPRDDVRLTRTGWWVRVRTSTRTLTILHGGRRAHRARVVVGAPATPTPTGLFAVLYAAEQRNPRAFLGRWAIHLTAHSDVLWNYGGGPGRVALHGRGGASFADPLGSARSHGCVRVDDRTVRRLARLPAGTPVEIRR